jgi:hypothetical protein
VGALEPLATLLLMKRVQYRPRRFARAGLAIATLVAIAVPASGCGGASSGDAAGAGTTAGARTVSRAGVFGQALAFSGCMRTHGEPTYPDPTVKGGSVHETIVAGSGVDPSSPQFTAARNACKRFLPDNGAPGPSEGQQLTPAEQAVYLRAAACMRSHDVPDFPDPTFRGGGVAFQSRTPIDTNTPQYRSALTTCRKLIPAGLPYSSSG